MNMYPQSRKVIFTQLVLLVSLLFSGSLFAVVEKEPFTIERFEALQAQNEMILVDISASWCPDCAKQQLVLEEYQKDFPESNLRILSIDFDTQKEWVTHFRAPRQSTLLLFSGQNQIWFSVAETRKEKIYEALNEGWRPAVKPAVK
ncbi:MAG: thioredoxin family protein [Pseudomonadales bacterium]|nr:thioredoxin family protein [Pseudomonadales bacterium]